MCQCSHCGPSLDESRDLIDEREKSLQLQLQPKPSSFHAKESSEFSPYPTTPSFHFLCQRRKAFKPPTPCAGKRKRVSPSLENKEQMNIPFQRSQKFLAHPETSYSKVSATALFLVFLIHVNCSHALRVYYLQHGRSYKTCVHQPNGW